MSAHQVSPNHIASIIRAGASIPAPPEVEMVRSARLLAQANAAAVGDRYSETVDPVQVDVVDIRCATPLSVTGLLKALDGLEYQLCEAREYRGSSAEALVSRIRCEAIRRLPGYDSAAWSL